MRAINALPRTIRRHRRLARHRPRTWRQPGPANRTRQILHDTPSLRAAHETAADIRHRPATPRNAGFAEL